MVVGAGRGVGWGRHAERAGGTPCLIMYRGCTNKKCKITVLFYSYHYLQGNKNIGLRTLDGDSSVRSTDASVRETSFKQSCITYFLALVEQFLQ